jgi:hypothetical protein
MMVMIGLHFTAWGYGYQRLLLLCRYRYSKGATARTRKVPTLFRAYLMYQKTKRFLKEKKEIKKEKAHADHSNQYHFPLKFLF